MVKSKRAARGQRGLTGARGAKGERGPAGAPGPEMSRERLLGLIDETFTELKKEMSVQSHRMAQIQAQLDAMEKLLRQLAAAPA
jgi:phosphoserine aminotransferase